MIGSRNPRKFDFKRNFTAGSRTGPYACSAASPHLAETARQMLQPETEDIRDKSVGPVGARRVSSVVQRSRKLPAEVPKPSPDALGTLGVRRSRLHGQNLSRLEHTGPTDL